MQSVKYLLIGKKTVGLNVNLQKRLYIFCCFESSATAYLVPFVRFPISSKLGEGKGDDRASKASQMDSTNPDTLNSGELRTSNCYFDLIVKDT